MRTLLAFLVLASTCLAQPAKQPNDADKYWFTIITHADWNKRPDEKALVENIQKEPLLSAVRSHRFNHITTGKKMYSERFESLYPEDSLPVVIRQRPDGGYVYKASGRNIPQGADALMDDIKFYATLTPSEGESTVVNAPDETEDEEYSDRPWKRPTIDQDDSLPDSVTIFGGKTPLRDSLGFGVEIMILVLACIFLVIVLVVSAVALAVLRKF